MVLFNKIVICEKDTNVHGAYPDWYDGGKTTLSVGGTNETCALMKFTYSEPPNYGAGKLHSAKLLVYPTAVAYKRDLVEPKRFKIYKVNRQLEHEGSLDAVTTDIIVGSSVMPNDNTILLSEKFLGRDIDGDGNPDKGDSIIFTAYELITKVDPYITIDEALDVKDGIFDSYRATNAEQSIKDTYAEQTNSGEWRIYLITRRAGFGRVTGRAKWYPKKGGGSSGWSLAPGTSSRGVLSFRVGVLEKRGLPHYGRRTVSTLKLEMEVENIITSDTTFFDTVRYSENIVGGTSERQG